jgi:predicted nucleic acid-binding protein
VRVYVDSSVVLRVLRGQKDAWKDWGRWEKAYSSTLLRVECRRFIDRMRTEAHWSDEDIAQAGELLRKLERVLGKIRLTTAVLERACLPMPTTVKTLDAIHIASATLLRERSERDLIFVTHDQQQARAARALGFEVTPKG